MQLLTNAALIKKNPKNPEYLRKHLNTNKFKEKENKIIVIFQPQHPSSDPISYTSQKHFPELHDVHGVLLTQTEQKSGLRAVQRSVLRSHSLVG